MSIREISNLDFDAEVLNSRVPVVLEIWAPSCSPCKMLQKELELLSAEKGAAVKFLKLNVEADMCAASRLRISSLPTTLFFKGSSLVETKIGTISRQKISEIIDRSLLS